MSATEPHLLCRWHDCPSAGPFSNAQALFEHLVNTHSQSAGTALSCDWDGCSRSSPLQGETERARHFRAHAGHKPFRCSHEACDASFCTEWQLKDHARRHRRTVRSSKLLCHWAGCRRSFTEDDAGAALLAAHLAAKHCASHSGCRWAGCRRRPRSSFKDHVIGHLPEWYKPFKCTICGKTFQRLNILTRHTNGAETPNGCLTKLRGGAGSGSLQGGMSAAADGREVEMLPPSSPLSILSSPPTSPATSPPPQEPSSPPSFFPSPPPPPTSSSPAPFQAEEELDVSNDRALGNDISNAALHARLLSAENLICEMQAEIDTLRQVVQSRARTPDDDFDWSLDE